MFNIHQKIFILFLVGCINFNSMMPRPYMAARARARISRSSNILHRSTRAPNKTPTRHYSQSPAKMLKTIEKQIKQCQITEHEYLEEYLSWDTIMTDCLWNGKCASGKCNPTSNCVLNRQMAYLAWQHAQKETVYHEYARIIAVLENSKKN